MSGLFLQATTYIQVPPVPGSISMITFDITNNNTVIGSYHDSAGVEHGFIGPLDGSNYKTIDFGGNAIGTEPRGIGYDGAIVGFAPTSGFILGQEFYRKPNRSEEHTSELQSRLHLVCRLLLEKKK